jgi:hypothetical protein
MTDSIGSDELMRLMSRCIRTRCQACPIGTLEVSPVRGQTLRLEHVGGAVGIGDERRIPMGRCFDVG